VEGREGSARTAQAKARVVDLGVDAGFYEQDKFSPGETKERKGCVCPG